MIQVTGFHRFQVTRAPELSLQHVTCNLNHTPLVLPISYCPLPVTKNPGNKLLPGFILNGFSALTLFMQRNSSEICFLINRYRYTGDGSILVTVRSINKN